MPSWYLGGRRGGGTLAGGLIAGVVAVDQPGTHQNSSSGVTSLNYTGQTISSGLNNPALVAILVNNANNAGFSAPSATWTAPGAGAQSMTLLNSDHSIGDTSIQVVVFGLASANAGSGGAGTIAFSWTGSTQVTAGSISLYNVNPTTPFPSTATFDNGGVQNTSWSYTCSSASGHLVVTGSCTDQGFIWTDGSTNIFHDGSIFTGADGRYLGGAAPNVTISATSVVAYGAFISVDVSN